MMIKMIWDNYDGDDDDIDNENDDDDDDDVIETAPDPLIGTIDLGTGRPCSMMILMMMMMNLTMMIKKKMMVMPIYNWNWYLGSSINELTRWRDIGFVLRPVLITNWLSCLLHHYHQSDLSN